MVSAVHSRPFLPTVGYSSSALSQSGVFVGVGKLATHFSSGSFLPNVSNHFTPHDSALAMIHRRKCSISIRCWFNDLLLPDRFRMATFLRPLVHPINQSPNHTAAVTPNYQFLASARAHNLSRQPGVDFACVYLNSTILIISEQLSLHG